MTESLYAEQLLVLPMVKDDSTYLKMCLHTRHLLMPHAHNFLPRRLPIGDLNTIGRTSCNLYHLLERRMLERPDRLKKVSVWAQ